jgi:hypothetical protein
VIRSKTLDLVQRDILRRARISPGAQQASVSCFVRGGFVPVAAGPGRARLSAARAPRGIILVSLLAFAVVEAEK